MKREIRVPVAPRILAAKTATPDELLAILDRQQENIGTLSSNDMRVNFTSGKLDSGTLQEYRSAQGYVLLRRGGDLRLNIQNPLTKTTILEMVSRGNNFSIWYPRENKFLVGQNSTREFDLQDGQTVPSFSARPIHIYDALMAERISLQDPALAISVEEARDSDAKYYVVSLFEQAGPHRLRPLRRVWFERSELTVVRMQTFEADGSVASILHYAGYVQQGNERLPHEIRIDRPGDGYTLEFLFKSWTLNPELGDAAFTLAKPVQAELIELKPKK